MLTLCRQKWRVARLMTAFVLHPSPLPGFACTKFTSCIFAMLKNSGLGTRVDVERAIRAVHYKNVNLQSPCLLVPRCEPTSYKLVQRAEVPRVECGWHIRRERRVCPKSLFIFRNAALGHDTLEARRSFEKIWLGGRPTCVAGSAVCRRHLLICKNIWWKCLALAWFGHCTVASWLDIDCEQDSGLYKRSPTATAFTVAFWGRYCYFGTKFL